MLKYKFLQILAAVLICSCDRAVAESSSIGTLAELTGRFSRFGEDCQRGYQLAQDRADKGIVFISGDNQNDPKIAISEFRRMVDLEQARIVVTTRSPVGLALNPLSLQKNPPLVGVIGHPRFVSENPLALRAFPSASDEAAALASLVNSRNESRVAVITIEDDYFLSLQREFENKVGETRIVFSETIGPAEQDFASLVLRVKRAAPTAIFINVGPAQIGPLISKIAQSKLTHRLYSNFLVGMSDVYKSLPIQAEGIAFAEVDYEKPEFLRLFSNKFKNAETGPIGYSCYVALCGALELLSLAERNSITVGEAMAKLTIIPTYDGPIRVVNREAQFELVSRAIQDGISKKLSR